ncbi:MAG TPA: Gfo/Idh/MocA family oxidoreductase [Thermomicrobiales bacterium]|nr:Gfo/Idh/MocA family oxidoreductase [Thermomicrobiales bacterium]HRA47491.1 Gfo/Idh/MocA family oxidoreductase [Thermomicrobiales bacterium]
MSANGKLGIAIQGAGTVSSGHLRSYLKNPHCQVVAIGSRTKEGAAAKAREVGIDPGTITLYDDIDALASDPAVDAVSICSPSHLHAAHVITLAKAGKHVLVEKPIAIQPDELFAMDAAVTKAGVKSVCGFVLRYNPMVETAKSLIDAGTFGEILYVQTDYWHNSEQSGYPNQEDHIRRMDGSAMMLGGCHAVDLARYLMGSNIVSVSAVETRFDTGAPYATMQSAVATFANGRIGKISACVEHWMPYQFNVDILGTEGGLRDDRFYTRALEGAMGFATFPTITPNSGLVNHHPFEGEINHFVNCIKNNVESHASIHDAVNTHLAIYAIDASGANGGAPTPVGV